MSANNNVGGSGIRIGPVITLATGTMVAGTADAFITNNTTKTGLALILVRGATDGDETELYIYGTSPISFEPGEAFAYSPGGGLISASCTVALNPGDMINLHANVISGATTCTWGYSVIFFPFE